VSSKTYESDIVRYQHFSKSFTSVGNDKQAVHNISILR